MNNIHLRKLTSKERDISTKLSATPLVLEHQGSGKGTLEELMTYLSDNSDELVEGLDRHGALLLRNFKIESEVDFENALTSLSHINCMDDYFLAETGRLLVEDTKYVFYTNKFYKTGAGLAFGIFHNEGYRSADVPHYVSFCCLKPSRQGGETGLVDMAGVYTALSSELKAKLESKTFFSESVSLSFLAKKYDVPITRVEEFCQQQGYKITTDNDSQDKTLVLFKPTVIEHPRTKRPAVIMNMGLKIMKGLENYFKEDYRGSKWWLHRLSWKYKFIYYLDMISRVSRISEKNREVKKEASLMKIDQAGGTKSKIKHRGSEHLSYDTLEKVITTDEGKQFQKAFRENFVSFRWEKGDVLIVDNLRMCHAGMPGKGARTVRAIMSNPVQFELSETSPGRQSISPGPHSQTAIQKLRQL